MDITWFLNNVNKYIVNPLIGLLFALSFVYFIYGIVKFLYAGSDSVDKSRVEAQDSIKWGIFGMVIMFSVFGIIKLIMNVFDIQPIQTINGVTVEPVKYIDGKLR
jgi:uncharacterized membrane protein YjfL (UPF0719 family)